MDAVQVVWFKRDLRVRDHAPLTHAARRGPVLPLYIVEPGLLRQPDYGPRHWTFVRESLRELRASLAALGQPLLVRTGEVVDVLEALHAAVPFAALWAHEEIGTAWVAARNAAVRNWAAAQLIPFTELRSSQPAGSSPPAILRPLPSPLSPGSIPTHQQLGLPPEDRAVVPPAGEAAGLALLECFVAELAGTYARAQTDALHAPELSSRLGPHLAWGTIVVRNDVLRMENSKQDQEQGEELPLFGILDGGEPSEDTSPPTAHRPPPTIPAALNAFAARLRARERALRTLADEPQIERESLIPAFDELRATELPAWRDGPDRAERLSAWRTGQTGYPLVDAAMRALRATGWLGFPLRALLVSFAAYDLWLPWQRLHPPLARLWLDYEPAIHLWQLQLQSGVTGAMPRPADPLALARVQDPTGAFIRRWIPELRRYPDEAIHQPHLLPTDEQARLGCVIGTDYPTPIVDHEIVARAARTALVALRQRPDVAAALVARRTGRGDTATRRRAQGQLTLF